MTSFLLARRRACVALAVSAVALAFTAVSFGELRHAGWPPNLHIIKQNGPAGRSHTLRGLKRRHNEILGGDGNDTIYGGPQGDVIWGDWHPSGQPTGQVDTIYAGNGRNFIYTSHGTNNVFTGSSPLTFVQANHGQGTIHCGSPRQQVNTTRSSGYRFVGCAHVRR